MSLLAIAGIVTVVYVVVGVITFSLMKVASDADDAMEAWSKEEPCI